MPDSELQRKYRVVDQMLTQHAALRDRYSSRAMTLKLLLLVCSVFLCGLALVTVSDWRVLGIDPAVGRWVLAIFSSMVFLLSLTETLVKWTERSESHRTAAVRLASMKARLRESLSQADTSNRTIKRLSSECDEVLASLPPVRESDFLKLKAAHLRKVAISSELDKRPGAFVWLLRLELLAQSCLKKWVVKDGRTGS